MLTIAASLGEIKSGEIYYNEYHATVLISEAESLLYVIWHGFIDPVNYKETMELVQELLKEKKLTNYLVDIEYMLNPEMQTKAKAAKYFFPELLLSSLKKAAIVSAEKDFIQPFTIINTKLNASSQKQVAYFRDQQAAYNWLIEEVPAQKETIAA